MAGRKASIIFLSALLIIGISLAIYSFASSQKTLENTGESIGNEEKAKECFSLGNALPSSSEELKLLDHKYYMVGYDTKHKQAAYVAYLLTAEMVQDNDNVSRKGVGFKKDYLLSDNYATKQDYTNSGYVRGHLCPSKDMCWSFASMKETFYMSNVSPQYQSFNDGLWKKLEGRVRQWAVENDSILVLCGPVLSSKKGEIGENRVSVCSKFYKVVVDISYPTYKMIAFIMDNTNIKGNIFRYCCNVREVEQITGLNFFPSQDANPLIDSLETLTDTKLWQ